MECGGCPLNDREDVHASLLSSRSMRGWWMRPRKPVSRPSFRPLGCQPRREDIVSGLAGIYHLDGRPVDPDLLGRMTDVVNFRSTDGRGEWIDGPVGLGHRMLHTTPESLHEVQPLLDETGNLCLVLDGRVDNREELKAGLEVSGITLRTDTDAEIVLRSTALGTGES